MTDAPVKRVRAEREKRERKREREESERGERVPPTRTAHPPTLAQNACRGIPTSASSTRTTHAEASGRPEIRPSIVDFPWWSFLTLTSSFLCAAARGIPFQGVDGRQAGRLAGWPVGN